MLKKTKKRCWGIELLLNSFMCCQKLQCIVMPSNTIKLRSAEVYCRWNLSLSEWLFERNFPIFLQRLVFTEIYLVSTSNIIFSHFFTSSASFSFRSFSFRILSSSSSLAFLSLSKRACIWKQTFSEICLKSLPEKETKNSCFQLQ